MDRTYVTRRLSLSEYGVLSVLDEPVIEELEDIDIKLFEGDNYIYLMDMQGNKFYAEYLVKNDFTDLYVTTNQMNSSIQQTAEDITSSVSQIYATKETTNELSTRIKQTAKSIELTATDNGTSAGITIRLKNEDGTQIDSKSANITMNGLVKFTDLSGAGSTTINGSNITTGTIDASKVTVKNLNASNITSGTITGRAISGGTITGTSITNGSNFSVDKNGNMTCKNANITGGSIKVGNNFTVNSNGNMNCSNVNITGGKIKLDAGDASNPNFRIGDYLMMTDTYFCIGEKGFNSNSIEILASPWDASRIGMMDSSNNYTEILASGITTPSLTQTSLESIKKNISEFTKNATDIINKSDIYEYNLKTDEDTDRKMIGFVIGDKYRTPDEVLSKDGEAIRLYSAVGILWKGFQEREEIIKQLKEENKQKDKILAELISRVEQLEKEVQHD